MIIAGSLLMTDSPTQTRLVPGWVRVEGAKVVEVGAGACPHGVDLGEGAGAGGGEVGAGGGSGSWVIAPGFVDAHLHLPQFDVIGVDGLPLLAWLERAVFPAEARWADADFAGAMGNRVARRLISHGTTAIAAYGTVHHEGTAAALRAVAEAGLRGVVGQVLMDRNAPAELLRPAEQLIYEAAAQRGVGRIKHAVTPRFAVSCTDELMAMAGALAARTGQVVQTHLSETRDECALVERLGGCGYVEAYRRAGLLMERTIFGHGIWLSDAERAAIAGARGVVAHCPTANLFLAAGAMDRRAALQRGVRLALGSDVAGGPDVSMVRVARAMIETAKRLHPPFVEGGAAGGGDVPTAAACWWQITRGNAEAIGLEGGGRIEAGADADLVLLRPDVEWAGAVDPLSMLLYAWDERWIRRVVVNGRVVEVGGGAGA